MLRTSYTPGVEQKTPHFMPGQLKLEWEVAITKSQPIANWKPAAATIPLTAHKVGIGKYLSLYIIFEQVSNI